MSDAPEFPLLQWIRPGGDDEAAPSSLAAIAGLQTAPGLRQAWQLLQGRPDLPTVAAVEAVALRDLRQPGARIVAAQALDRRRWLRGEPQKFGTLAVQAAAGPELWPVDPTTTDSERAKWGLPPLRELQDLVVAGEA